MAEGKRTLVLSPAKLGKDAVFARNRFHLTKTGADVIFAFYGSNEAQAGTAGLAAFKANVDAFIKHVLAQQYNGKSAHVWFAHSRRRAHENLRNRKPAGWRRRQSAFEALHPRDVRCCQGQAMYSSSISSTPSGGVFFEIVQRRPNH